MTQRSYKVSDVLLTPLTVCELVTILFVILEPIKWWLAFTKRHIHWVVVVVNLYPPLLSTFRSPDDSIRFYPNLKDRIQTSGKITKLSVFYFMVVRVIHINPFLLSQCCTLFTSENIFWVEEQSITFVRYLMLDAWMLPYHPVVYS